MLAYARGRNGHAVKQTRHVRNSLRISARHVGPQGGIELFKLNGLGETELSERNSNATMRRFVGHDELLRWRIDTLNAPRGAQVMPEDRRRAQNNIAVNLLKQANRFKARMSAAPDDQVVVDRDPNPGRRHLDLFRHIDIGAGRRRVA